MTYTPTNQKALAAHEVLKRDKPKGKALTTNIEAPYDRADLKQLLTAYYCPVVCVGVTNEGENWHATCENAAEAALQLLMRNKTQSEV